MNKTNNVKSEGISFFLKSNDELVTMDELNRCLNRSRDPRGLLTDIGGVLGDEALVKRYGLGVIREQVMLKFGNPQFGQVVCADLCASVPFVPFWVNNPKGFMAGMVNLWQSGSIEPGTVANLTNGAFNLCYSRAKVSTLYEYAKEEVRVAREGNSMKYKDVVDAPPCFVQSRFEKGDKQISK